MLLVVSGLMACTRTEDRIFFMKYPEPPSVITNEPEDVTTNTANLGGIIVKAGSGAVFESGINIYPEGVSDLKGLYPTREFREKRYSEKTEVGYFSVYLRDLKPNTTYHYRAFASNEAGTANGEMKILVTKDSNAPQSGK